MTEPRVEQLFRKRPEDDAIPVLTEVLQPTEPSIPAPQAPDVDSLAASSVEPAASETPPLDAIDLAQFADALRESVLTRLHPRIDSTLEQRLDEIVRAALDELLPVLRRQLRESLSVALNDIVSRAIAKELARLYAQRPVAKPAQDPDR